MANGIEKIFKMIINFGDSEKRIPEVGKMLQSLVARLKNVLTTIIEIGKTNGFERVADALRAYNLVAKESEKQRRKGVETTKTEQVQNEAAAKIINTLARTTKNLVFTSKEAAAIQRNGVVLAKSQKGSVEGLTAHVNILTIAWRKMSAEQRNSADGKKVTADLRALRLEIRRLTMSAGDNSRNIGNYVSGIYNAITVKAAAITGVVYTLRRVVMSIYEPFQDLEIRMAMVKAITRATDAEFMALTLNARRLGATTEYTATEVAGLQLSYGRMGFVPAQIEQITAATLDLATATGENLSKSADVVGVALKGFNLDASQTQRVVDVMAQSFNASSLQLDSFYESIKYVAPIAAQANVSIEQTAAMLGILADRGIRGSQAGTALRRIFTEIAKEGGNVGDRLEVLSKRGLTLGGAMDEVGRYAMTALTVLSGSKGAVDALEVSLTNAGGSAKKAADIMRDTMKGDMDKLLSAVAEKLISIGEFLAPLARGVMQFGTTFVTNAKQITLAVGASAAVIAIWNSRVKIKIALTQLWSLHSRASALATALNTASLVGNITAMRAYSTVIHNASLLTKVYAIAKMLLTGNLKAATTAMRIFTGAMLKNPFGLVAVALASVVSYLVFFRKRADGATSAQKRFNDENDRFNKAQDEKRQKIEQLIQTIQDENETERARILAYGELQQLSPVLTEKYNQEQIATLKLADAAKTLNEENDKAQYDHLTKQVDEYTTSLKKLEEENGKTISITTNYGANNYTIDNSAQIAARKVELANYQNALDKVVQAQKQADENLKPIQVRITAAENIEQQAKIAFDAAAKEYNKKRDEWIKLFGSESVIPISFALNKTKTENELKAAQDKLEALRKQQNTTTTDPKPDKGEWSLAKDKEHNSQLLSLKQRLLSGEITSEGEYQKQVLQLEVDTLRQRIALNKDGSETLSKLRSDLLDKQIQQSKAEKKTDQDYTASRKSQADTIARYDLQHREADLQSMEEGLDKKIQLNELSTEKTLLAAQKEYDAKIEGLNKEQQAHKGNKAKIEEIEAEKTALAARFTQKTTDIVDAGADARIKIIRDATTEELIEYGKIPGRAADVEKAITDNKRIELEKRKKLTQESLADANAVYNRNEGIADATHGTDPNDKARKAARLQNELDIRQAQAQTYLAELAWMEQNEAFNTERYKQVIANIGQLNTELGNIGRGKTPSGEGGGFLQGLFNLNDEQVVQIKQQALSLASQLSDALFSAQQQASERQLNSEKKTIDAEYKIHSKMLDSKRDKGLISEKTYQNEMEKLEAEKAKKEEAAERAAFERKKKLDIKQAIVNTALAVGSALATSVPFMPMGPIMAAFAFAQGMVQVATIASQKYAQGGLIPLGNGTGVVKGRSHAQGGHRIYLDGQPIGEIEGDELLAIVNKRDTARIGALSEANSVHGRKFAQGGLVSPSRYMTTSVAPPIGFYASMGRGGNVSSTQLSEVINLIREDTRQQVEAINSRIDTLRVVVVAQDMTDEQCNIKKVKVKSSW